MDLDKIKSLYSFKGICMFGFYFIFIFMLLMLISNSKIIIIHFFKIYLFYYVLLSSTINICTDLLELIIIDAR